MPSRTSAQKSLRSEWLSSQLNVRSHAPSARFNAPTQDPKRFDFRSGRGRLLGANVVECIGSRGVWAAVDCAANADVLTALAGRIGAQVEGVWIEGLVR